MTSAPLSIAIVIVLGFMIATPLGTYAQPTSLFETTASGPIQSSVLKQISIYICGRLPNGTAEWCW